MSKIFVKNNWSVFLSWLKVFSITGGISSRLSLIKLFIFTLWKRILGLNIFLPIFNLKLSKKFGNTELKVRDMADITTIAAIFGGSEYELNIDPDEVKTIVDLGANIGISVAYFNFKYPSSQIYAVEADPNNFLRLKENCSGLKNIVLIHAAINYENGPVLFNENESSVSGSIYNRGCGKNKIEVEGIKIDDLIIKNNISDISILKFDIEGSEFKSFSNSSRVFTCTKIIIGEVHPDIGKQSAEDFLKLFFGYKVKVSPREKGRFILKAEKIRD